MIASVINSQPACSLSEITKKKIIYFRTKAIIYFV